MRHAHHCDRARFGAERPDLVGDLFDDADFADFDLDLLIVEEGFDWGGVNADWKMPAPLVTGFIEGGGVVIVVDQGLNRLKNSEARRDLRLFGAYLEPDDSPEYLADSVSHGRSDRELVISPSRMEIDGWLQPAYEGVARIVAQGVVPLIPLGQVSISSEPTARKLRDDVFTDWGAPCHLGQSQVVATDLQPWWRHTWPMTRSQGITLTT